MAVFDFMLLALWTLFYYKFFYDKKNKELKIFNNYSPWNISNLIFFFLAYIPLFKFCIAYKEEGITLVNFFIVTIIPAFFISLSIYLVLKSFIFIESRYNKFRIFYNFIRNYAFIFLAILVFLGMYAFDYEILMNEGRCLEYSYSIHGSYCEEYE